MLLTIALAIFVIGASYLFIRYNDLPGKYNTYKTKIFEFDYIGYYQKLKYLFKYMWPEDRAIRMKVVACFVLMLIGRVLNVVVPLLGKMIIDQQTTKKYFVGDLISMSFGYLCLQGNGYVNQVMSDAQSTIFNSVRLYMGSRIKIDMYKHILRLPYSWFKDQKGDALSVFYNSVSKFENFPEYLLFNFTSSIADAFFAFAVFASTFDYQSTLMVSSVAIAYFTFNRYIYLWGAPDIPENDEEEDDDEDEKVYTYGLCSDTLTNYETVKYFCTEDREQKRFEEAIEQEDRNYLKGQTYSQFRNTVINIVNDCLMMLGAFLMAYQRSSDETSELTAGDYVLFSSFFGKFTQPLYSIEACWNQIKYSVTDADEVIELLAQPHEDFGAKLKDVEIKGGLRLDNVSFSYPEGEEVLHKVSFEVPEGTTLALVGPTGSGKSTLVRLLYRFLHPTEGSILINDIDINDYNVYDYRKQIGVVPQDCFLFDKSIKYNLEYANAEATEEEIQQAIRAAQIDEMIQKKPKKMKTNVGDGGTKLSGGERQRMAIARTILKRTKYLLMDEATSSLDTVTERQIQKALTDLAKNKTCVIVAHRLSTIVHADNIVVLKNGQVLEQGNHKQLIEKHGLYAEMWTLQQGGNFDQ